jgi:hypothetical protein
MALPALRRARCGPVIKLPQAMILSKLGSDASHPFIELDGRLWAITRGGFG